MSQLPEFIPGLELSEAYYREAIRPILDANFPNLPHSAALIGYSSDVQGFDTPVSRDHLWGPRVFLFLQEQNFASQRAEIHAALRQNLPPSFRGYSTHFSAPDAADGGTRVMQQHAGGPVEPLIFYETLASFWAGTLGIEPGANLEALDWLTLSEQALLEVTGGKVFHDDLGLKPARRSLAYYPREVWLYLLAAQWTLIAQEEAFVGRTTQVGDELGSRIVAARLVERLMHLCFLMEKRYTPYSKWFGTAFRRLECAARLGPLFESILAAASFPERDQLFAQAYTAVAEMHNALGITAPLEARTRTYSGWHALREGITDLPLEHPRNTRPHQVIFAGRFADAIRAAIHDPAVLALPPNFGSVSQFLVGSSDAVQSTRFRRALRDDLE